jgi:hypothetical protein
MSPGNIFNWIWFEAMDFAEHYSAIAFWGSLIFMGIVNLFAYLVCSHGMFLTFSEDSNLFMRLVYIAVALYYAVLLKWWWMWLVIPFGVSIMVWSFVYCHAYAHCRSWGGK